MKKIYISLLVLVFFVVFGGYAVGQSNSLDGGFSSLTGTGSSKNNNIAVNLSLSPKYPGAKESATVLASSFQVDLDTTFITWYQDGEMKLSGVGKKNFTFNTGVAGNTSVIKISMDTTKFGSVSKEISVTPTDLDILWEADTYVPPFYKGKALPSSQSTVRVVPFPSFVGSDGYFNSKDLVYKWKAGYFGNPEDSGYGKNTFIYKTGYAYNTDTIEATVSTMDGGLSVTKKTPIYVSEPKVVFYENQPLGGMRYENSLTSSFRFTNNEITVHAVPYFFSLIGLDSGAASFDWRLDGRKLETDPDNIMEFTFRKPDKGSGKFQLGLTVDNIGYSLQTTSKKITISYDNQ